MSSGTRCRMDCGFYAAPSKEGLCTQCYKIHVEGVAVGAGSGDGINDGGVQIAQGLLEPSMPARQIDVEEEKKGLSTLDLAFRRALVVGSKLDVELELGDEDAMPPPSPGPSPGPSEEDTKMQVDEGKAEASTYIGSSSSSGEGPLTNNNMGRSNVWRDGEVHRAVLDMLLIRYTEWELKLEWISRFSPRLTRHKTKATKRPPRQDLPDYSHVDTKLGPESLPRLGVPRLTSEVALKVPKDRYKGMSSANILSQLEEKYESGSSSETSDDRLAAYLEFLEMYMADIVKDPSWLKASRALVERILARDFLNIQEIDLFMACGEWAKANKDQEQDTKDCIANLLPHIRFGSMTNSEIAKITPLQLVPSAQCIELFMYKAHQSDAAKLKEYVEKSTLKFNQTMRLGRPRVEEGDGGVMKIVAQPGDNSCLFHSVGYVCDGEHLLTTVDAKRDKVMCNRKRVSDMIASLANTKDDPLSDSAILGMTSEVYSNAILEMNKWGGALDLQMFARIFRCEIYSFDLNGPNVYRFGVGQGYSKRVFIAYSGNHYDALEYQNPFHKHWQRYFSVHDMHALKLAKQCIEEHYRQSRNLGKEDTIVWLGRGFYEVHGITTPTLGDQKSPFSSASGTDLKTESLPQWSCRICTLLNPGTRVLCNACGQPKVAKPTTPWECSQCKTKNPPERNHCAACDARRAT